MRRSQCENTGMNNQDSMPPPEANNSFEIGTEKQFSQNTRQGLQNSKYEYVQRP